MNETKLRQKFDKGEMVELDKGFTNESFVHVVEQTEGRLFTRVSDEDRNEWEVMTSRLSRIVYSDIGE